MECEVSDHIRLSSHLLVLKLREMTARLFPPGLSGLFINDPVIDETGLLDQHDPPREAKALLGPIDVLAIEHVPTGKQHQ